MGKLQRFLTSVAFGLSPVFMPDREPEPLENEKEVQKVKVNRSRKELQRRMSTEQRSRNLFNLLKLPQSDHYKSPFEPTFESHATVQEADEGEFGMKSGDDEP